MDVAEELIEFEDRIDLAHVEKRVLDWETRVHGLYARIASWLPSGWTSSIDGTAILREPLMVKFGVAERHLPRLALSKDGVERVRLEPRYLWIIGSNGRVDMRGSTGHFLINDRSEFFEEPSWHIAAFRARLEEMPLTVESFRRALQ